MEEKLICKNLFYKYNNDSEYILENINIEINTGITALIGKSGSGKTTFSKLLLGILKPTKGELINSYLDMGYLPQNNLLLQHLTVKENISLPLKIKKQKDIKQSELDKIIKLFEVEKLVNKYPHELSGGQKSRVAFLRAYLMSSKFIILDEPFAALDYEIKEKLLKWMRGISQEMNLKILFITHNLEDANKYADNTLEVKSKSIQKKRII